MIHKKIMVEDFSKFHKEQLLELKNEYLEYMKKYGKTEVVWGRVNSIDLALKKREKSLKPRDY